MPLLEQDSYGHAIMLSSHSRLNFDQGYSSRNFSKCLCTSSSGNSGPPINRGDNVDIRWNRTTKILEQQRTLSKPTDKKNRLGALF